MIVRLEHSDQLVAESIYSIFQLSYKVEAEILGVSQFPPLNRKISDFMKSENLFYAYKIKNKILGVVELENKASVHIQSLVVDPMFFRKGIARQLIDFVLDRYKNKTFTVETGLNNYPAVSLYKSYGFKEVEKYIAEFNIIKIRFEL